MTEFIDFLATREGIKPSTAKSLASVLLGVHVNNVSHLVMGTRVPSRQTVRFLVFLVDYITRLNPDLAALYLDATGKQLKRIATAEKS